MSVTSLLEKFSESVEHIHGNLYRVKRSEIQIAPPFDADASSLVFGNPRWVKDQKGKLKAKGILGSKEEQREIELLRGAVARKGLHNPLKLRVTEDALMLIDGERRFRSITKLCEDGEEVYNPVDGSTQSAGDVYDYIECRIEEMGEEEALENAIIASETGVGVGDTAILNVVGALRKQGYDKESIKKIAGGKSETWWRETTAILELDEESLCAFQNEEINRRVAIQLAKIQNLEERLERLAGVRDALAQHIARKKEKLTEQIERQESVAQDAEVDLETAKSLEEESVAADKVIKAYDELDDTQSKLQDLEVNPPAATEKHLNEASDDTPKPWSFAKIKKHWLDELPEILRREGKNEDGDDLGIDLNDVRLAKILLDAIDKAKKDEDGKTPVSIVTLLQAHNRKKK